MTEIDQLMAAVAAADNASKVAGATKQLGDALGAWAQSVERRLGAPAPPPPAQQTVAPPLKPSGYTVPAGATVCSTVAQLKAALQGSAPLVLAPGEYDDAAPLTNPRGLPIYSAEPGRAILRAGLVLGGNAIAAAPLVQGVTFGAHDPAKGLGGAALHIWGPAGRGARVLDSFWDGGGSMPFGLLCYQPDALTLARAQQTSAYAQVVWRLSDNEPASPALIAQVCDLDGAGALEYLNGTAGVVLWLGHEVASCGRLRLGHGATASLETVNAFAKTAISDLELYGSPVGHYCEHFTRGSTFTRGRIHDCEVGINGEWDDDIAGNAATHGCSWDSFEIATAKAGAYFDKGSEANAVTNTRFKGQSWAAVGAYLNTGVNDFATGNTYEMAPGAVQLATAHI